MSEQDVAYAKINIVKNCIMAIERVQKEKLDPVFEIGLYELNLQRAIQACIDLANVVIAKEGLGLPTTYRQSFEILKSHGVIDESLTKTMSSMVGFRNISVHDYGEIKPEIVRSIVKSHLTDFENFYRVIYQRTQAW